MSNAVFLDMARGCYILVLITSISWNVREAWNLVEHTGNGERERKFSFFLLFCRSLSLMTRPLQKYVG